VPGISIVRIADGKIVEHWLNWDALGLFQDLGLSKKDVDLPESHRARFVSTAKTASGP
jgi:hypothetical protein